MNAIKHILSVPDNINILEVKLSGPLDYHFKVSVLTYGIGDACIVLFHYVNVVFRPLEGAV